MVAATMGMWMLRTKLARHGCLERCLPSARAAISPHNRRWEMEARVCAVRGEDWHALLQGLRGIRESIATPVQSLLHRPNSGLDAALNLGCFEPRAVRRVWAGQPGPGHQGLAHISIHLCHCLVALLPPPHQTPCKFLTQSNSACFPPRDRVRHSSRPSPSVSATLGYFLFLFHIMNFELCMWFVVPKETMEICFSKPRRNHSCGPRVLQKRFC